MHTYRMQNEVTRPEQDGSVQDMGDHRLAFHLEGLFNAFQVRLDDAQVVTSHSWVVEQIDDTNALFGPFHHEVCSQRAAAATPLRPLSRL